MKRAFTLFETTIGRCGIAWCDDTVVATHLPEASPAATSARLAARARAVEGEPPETIRRGIRAITALLEGQPVDLSFISCDLRGVDPFAAEVYAITRTIPPGETLTYGDIAATLGDKLLARDVGRALGRNRLPIIIPCHRVVGAGGKLIGFSAQGGTETKRRLLVIEGADFSEPEPPSDQLQLPL